MKLSAHDKLAKRPAADLIVVPFWEGQKKAQAAATLGALSNQTTPPIANGDFKAKEGQFSLVYAKGEVEPRILLVGLGKPEALSTKRLRDLFASVARRCLKGGGKCINILLPHLVELRDISADECLVSVAEGLSLANYRWDRFLSNRNEKKCLEKVCLIGTLPKALKSAQQALEVAEYVYLARDLVNGNADDVTPAFLVEVAQSLAKKSPSIKAHIFDKKRLVTEKMNLLLAVGQGSAVDPALIVLNYRGQPRSKDHTVLVGKGVTFDTGGLNLKPTSFIETMRQDMGGAATVLATIGAAAALKLKVNLSVVIPTTENAIGSKSFKPGDVFTGYLGKSVEIGNTDAEGRLILADALSYAASELKPSRIIDFATLTGAIVIALGEEIAGVMSNNETLVDQLLASASSTDELLWQMPLHAPYKELLKSDIADIKNVGGRAGGSITAALFLQEFVKEVPWAHIDIAGTASSSKEKNTLCKGGVGFGIRLLIDFLKNLPE